MRLSPTRSLLLALTFCSAPLFANINPLLATNTTTPVVSLVCEAVSASDSIATKRAKYLCEIENYLHFAKDAMDHAKIDEKEQAQTLNALRRSIGKKYKDHTPDWLKPIMYGRNVKKYKDPLGPSYESLSKIKSDAEIIESAMRTGGQNLLLDQPIALSFVDVLNNWANGPLLNMITTSIWGSSNF